MNKVLDFDQFLKEKNSETLTIRVFGKDYSFPAQMPAIVPVMLGRAAEEVDAAQETKITVGALDMLLGKENVDELCQKGMTVPEFRLLAKKIFGMINGAEPEDGEAQEMTDADSRKPAGARSGGHGAKK